MKKILVILIFCMSKLLGQIGPPDLRCLEVLQNGNVKLTWIPPTDPTNQFAFYELYSSISKTGPYASTLLGLSTINTSTFVHATTAATGQTTYYFMLTKYGGSGTNSSAHSDTLNTIFLTSFPNLANGTQELKYNPIHKPKLSTTGADFSLNKEYPLGTWKLLTVSSNTIYPDTINICKAKMNYQVTLPDNSGCFSVSNLLMGDYSDIRNPERPYVDSISVLPDGNTVIGWQIPVDKDIEKYYIFYFTGVTNQRIDSISGRNNTSYVYPTSTANSSMVGVFVQAVDTCGNGSNVNYQSRTMFLRTAYNSCAYQTTLTWNKYIWSDIKGVPDETLGKYIIYYSVNGSAFSIVGETTDTNFVHSEVTPGKNICYFIRVVNNRLPKITASSNRSFFFSNQVETPHFIYLKTATVLDKTKIEIRVYIDNSRSCKGINIQRSENETDFTTIGFMPSTGDADYAYTDEGVSSNAKSYSYRILILDSCGNLRDASNTAKTMLLKVHEDDVQLFTKQLSWNKYVGFGGDVSGYNIYRIINGDVGTALVGSTDALTTTYTDNLEGAASEGAKIEYLVQAVEGIGNPYSIFERSSSNTVSVFMEGNIYVPNAFAPDGVNKTWLPITHFIEKTEYHVKVFNRWGKKVFESNDDATAWDGANCLADVYVYLIDYKNARGEYSQVKGTVLLLR